MEEQQYQLPFHNKPYKLYGRAPYKPRFEFRVVLYFFESVPVHLSQTAAVPVLFVHNHVLQRVTDARNMVSTLHAQMIHCRMPSTPPTPHHSESIVHHLCAPCKKKFAASASGALLV